MSDVGDAFPCRWVRIMALPDSCGFWNRDKQPGALAALPVPKELRERAAVWIASHEAHRKSRMSGEDVEFKTFAAEGLAIAHAVKAALPDWTVSIYDGTQALCRWPGLEIREERRLAEEKRLRAPARATPEDSAPESAEEAFPGQWVQVMGDFGASGFWNDKGWDCAAESLPIPQSLRERAAGWIDRYEELDTRQFDGECVDWGPFAAEGLAIARAVKAALPDWTVFYFDESRPRFQRPPETYCYEILADRPETEK